MNGLDATQCTSAVEVKFVRELGVGHTWTAGTETLVWNFFAAHGKTDATGLLAEIASRMGVFCEHPI